MRVLTSTDVRAAVSMTEAIAAVKAGYIALSQGGAVVPVRGAMETPNGTMLTMPAHILDDPVTVMKLVNIYPDNPSVGLPTIHAAVLVSSAKTGEPLLLMDGRVLTAIRTGAGSGVATDLLARRDAAVLGVIGTGAQARTQVEAVCAVRAIREIRLYSRTNPDEMASEISGQYGARVAVAPSVSAAVAGADVIVLATNSATPVLQLAEVASGAHINGVGSYKPTMQEVAADIVTAPNVGVFVDHRESVWEEAGDLIIPRDAGLFSDADIVAEIGEVAAGTQPGRVDDDQITFFKSVGNAVQDAVMARVILTALEQHDIGTVVNL